MRYGGVMTLPPRFLFGLGIAAATALAFGATTAPAEPVMPGEEGALAAFALPEPGNRVCFSRVYDEAHLKAHPKQKVTAMDLRIAYYKHDPDEYAPHGQRNYYFELDARLRGSDRVLSTGGECSATDMNDTISCMVECDGGGVVVKRLKKPGEILVDLQAFGRLRMTDSCDADEEEYVELEPGADDKQFLLRETGADACLAYEDW